MMAVDLPNRDQLQLQSQFFTEEEEEENISIIKPITKTYSSCFSSSGFGSIFSSPVESEQSSTEPSESDEEDDDYIAELTRKMALYTLQDEDNNRNEKEEEEEEGLDAEEWPKLGIKDKIENLHKNEEKNTDVDGGCLSEKPPIPNLDFQSKKALIDEQIRTIQLNKVKQEQFMKQQRQMELNRQFYLQQHRKGSEMRAVFLGQSGSKAGSNGTGVFLPRGITNNNNPTDSRKKTGCSTVLIPARVVQALKLQYERMGIESRYITGATFVNQNDGMILENLKYGQQQQQQQSEKKSQSQPVPVPAAMNNKEIIGLPQEWTY